MVLKIDEIPPEKENNIDRNSSLLQRLLSFCIIPIVLLFMFFQFLLPLKIEKGIAESFATGLDAEVTADIQAFPAWKLLRDDFDLLNISVVFPDGTIPLTSFQAYWVKSNQLLNNLKSGEGALKENGPEGLTLVWDKEDFQRFLQAKQGFLMDIHLEMATDTLDVDASTILFGDKRQISLTLIPGIDSEGNLVFTIEKVNLEGFSDDDVENKIKEALKFDLNILPLDWQYKADSVRIETDHISIIASAI